MAGLQKARQWFYYNQIKRKSKDFRKKNAFLKYIKCIFENRRQGRRGGSSGEQGCQGRFANKKRKATVPSVKEKGDACEEAPLRMHELFCLRQKSRERVSERCPDPAEAPPLHPAKGLHPFRNPFWGSLVYARALLPAAKIAWKGIWALPRPGRGAAPAPCEGTSSLSKPILGG